MTDELVMHHCAVCSAWRSCRKYRGIFICQRPGCWRQRKITHANNLYTRKVTEAKKSRENQEWFAWTCRKE